MNRALSEQQVAAQGRELSDARWELPAKFKITSAFLDLPAEEQKKQNPELYALWEKTKDEQARLAELNASPHARPSSQEIFRARSVQRAEEVRVTIERIGQQIGRVLTGVEDADLAELQAAKLALKHKRAEYLSTAGRYDLAFEEEPDPQYREHYLAILDAIYRDDEEHCGHGEVRGAGEYSNLTMPSFNAKEDVWSLKHGRMVTLMKCVRCGFMNAIDTPAHVQELRSHRANAARLASKMSIEDAARVLTEKGHTTAKLLGQKK